MKCPMCGRENIKTVDSRPDHDSIVRRKKCLTCNHRWSTIEIDKDQWYSALQIKEERKRGRSKDD
jgi:transcriptional regulator NrdR family protein